MLVLLEKKFKKREKKQFSNKINQVIINIYQLLMQEEEEMFQHCRNLYQQNRP